MAFGLAKSLTNLAAGGGAERYGRRRLLVIGWTLALPVPLLIALAPYLGRRLPKRSCPAVGVYRFWRDMGYVAGGPLAGVAADELGYGAAIAIIAGVTALSGLWVALDLPRTLGASQRPH